MKPMSQIPLDELMYIPYFAQSQLAQPQELSEDPNDVSSANASKKDAGKGKVAACGQSG